MKNTMTLIATIFAVYIATFFCAFAAAFLAAWIFYVPPGLPEPGALAFLHFITPMFAALLVFEPVRRFLRGRYIEPRLSKLR